MNKAQKIIQPLIDAEDRRWSTIRNNPDYERGYSSGTCNGLEMVRDALATLSDDITLADVPTVEWDFKPANENHNDHYMHGKWLVYPSRDANGIISSHGASLAGGSPHYWTTKDQAKRYVEIRIHLADLERKLLAELAGGA